MWFCIHNAPTFNSAECSEPVKVAESFPLRDKVPRFGDDYAVLCLPDQGVSPSGSAPWLTSSHQAKACKYSFHIAWEIAALAGRTEFATECSQHGPLELGDYMREELRRY